jgi:hypothetical protein
MLFILLIIIDDVGALVLVPVGLTEIALSSSDGSGYYLITVEHVNYNQSIKTFSL